MDKNTVVYFYSAILFSVEMNQLQLPLTTVTLRKVSVEGEALEGDVQRGNYHTVLNNYFQVSCKCHHTACV